MISTPSGKTPRKCLFCDKQFYPSQDTQKFCPGGICRYKYHNREKARNIRETKKLIRELVAKVDNL